MLINSSNLFVSCKNIDQVNNNNKDNASNHPHHHTKEENSCERVKEFFDSINVTINPTYDKTGKFAYFVLCKFFFDAMQLHWTFIQAFFVLLDNS